MPSAAPATAKKQKPETPLDRGAVPSPTPYETSRRKNTKSESARVAKCPSPYWIAIARQRRSSVPPPVDSDNCRWHQCSNVNCIKRTRKSEPPPACSRAYPFYYVRAAGGVRGLCEDCINENRARWEEELESEGIIEPVDSPRPFAAVCDAAAAAGISEDPIPLEPGDIVAIRELARLLLGMTSEHAAKMDPHELIKLCDAASIEQLPDDLPSNLERNRGNVTSH